MIKIATILGTRPEIIKLSQIIKKFDKFFTHKLIHTGQNYDYELNKIFFEDLKIRKPNFFLNAAGKDSNQSIGNIIIKSSEVLKKIKPDALFILGDTNSGLSSIAAKKLKIPIFHFEAGNRCFDLNVPEEINRKIILLFNFFGYYFLEYSSMIYFFNCSHFILVAFQTFISAHSQTPIN